MAWQYIVVWAITTILSALLTPRQKPQNARPGSFGDNVAFVDESTPIIKGWGTFWILQSNIVFFASTGLSAIKKKQKTKGLFGSKTQSYTAGYRYYAAFQAALCLGTITALTSIRVGDRIASKSYYAPGRHFLDNPNLFGGEDQEGGVQGDFEIQSGSYAQTPNQAIARLLNKNIPAYRGVSIFNWENGLVSCMSPYLKSWAFQVLARAEVQIVPPIGAFENPVNVFAEVITNTEWGLGDTMAHIDTENFTAVGAVLAAEGFGLCPVWNTQQTIGDFLLSLQETIDGALYVDFKTGLWKIKLLRDDTKEEDMLTLGPDDIIAVDEFIRPSAAEIINSVSVTFNDYTTGKEQTVTEHDIAGIRMANEMIISTTLTYPAIPTQSLARRIALREASQFSRGLATFSCDCTRKAASLNVGDPFILKYPPLGIEKMICRVKDISFGKSTDWIVRVAVIEDAFNMPQTVLDETPSEWTPPDTTPVNIISPKNFEVPYYLVSLWITEDQPSAWSDLGENWGFFATLAKQPGALTTGYYQYTRQNDNTYNQDLFCAFSDWFSLAEDIDDIATTLQVAVGQANDVVLKSLILIDDEFIYLTAVNTDQTVFTVQRGFLDTVPAAHSAGSTIWLVSEDDTSNPNKYSTGQTVNFRLPTESPTEMQNVAGVTSYTLTFQNRAERPIPPGNIRINGTYRPRSVSGGPGVLSWARRAYKDTTQPRTQLDADIKPEPGTTTSVIVSYRNSTSSAWVLAGRMNFTDETRVSADLMAYWGRWLANAPHMRIQVLGMRDGLESTYTQEIATDIISVSFQDFLTSQPPNPSPGDCYINPDNQFAIYTGLSETIQNWVNVAPYNGQLAFNQTTNSTYRWNGTEWMAQ